MPRKPPLGKSLAEVNPELVKEWRSTKKIVGHYFCAKFIIKK